MGNIYLIGMSGCGKTTVGSKLAALTNREFIDTDDMLARDFGMAIPRVFEQFGESVFRDEESRILMNLSKSNKNAVVSCGGGMALRKSNVALMKSSGTVVYLERDPDSIFACIDTQTRPLIVDDGANIRELYEKRRPAYEEAADITIENNSDPDSAVRAIISKLGL